MPETKSTRELIMDYLRNNAVNTANVTYREIAKACFLSSTSTVGFHLAKLEKEGLIRKIGHRSVQIVGDVGQPKNDAKNA